MKKLTALLLCVLMLLSVAPVAFAEDADADETTTVVSGTDDTVADEDLDAAFSLFGGFFEKIGEMLRIVFEFLENLFSGTGDKNIDYI